MFCHNRGRQKVFPLCEHSCCAHSTHLCEETSSGKWDIQRICHCYANRNEHPASPVRRTVFCKHKCMTLNPSGLSCVGLVHELVRTFYHIWCRHLEHTLAEQSIPWPTTIRFLCWLSWLASDGQEKVLKICPNIQSWNTFTAPSVSLFPFNITKIGIGIPAEWIDWSGVQQCSGELWETRHSFQHSHKKALFALR